MTKLDDRVPSPEPGDDPRGFWQWLACLRAALQDCMWREHEAWTAERGYQSGRSPSGWRAYGRDPRFDYREACRECDGTGRHPIAIEACGPCDGTGVVTFLPDDYYDDDPDGRDDGEEPR